MNPNEMTCYPYGYIRQPWARGVEARGSEVFVVRVNHLGSRSETEHATRDAAMRDLFQPFAWPGGYPVAWSLANGDTLCPACAEKAYEDDEGERADMASGRASATIYEGGFTDHGRVACDNCNKVIIGEDDE